MAVFQAYVTAGADDGLQDNTGVIDSDETTTGATGGLVWTFTRFQNVTIPQGSTINSAKVTIYIGSTSADSPDFNLYAHDVDDSWALTAADNDISSRTRTTAYTNWTANDIGTGSKDSPSLTSVIQEVVDRPGWASGNSLAIIWDSLGTGNLVFAAYEHATNDPAQLTIDYTAPAGGGLATRAAYYNRRRRN